ncbi:MAG: hypothetical protein JKX94_11710, partial [Sneathiella sp.]|nr:hypothetical protein [Sneathiella sp.]
ILSYLFFGLDLILSFANGSEALALLGDEYMSLVIYFSALFFISAMLGDSFRCQGKIGAMTLITLLSTVLNILFDYILIIVFEMGVAGTAYATALAQASAILAALMYQYSDENSLHFKLKKLSGIWHNWGNYLALGAPLTLTYVGISVISGSIIYQLQIWDSETYEVSVAAYGIVTRLLTFGYMPLLGLTLAQQTIVGNNFGAKNWGRTTQSLKICVITAAIYCAIMQAVFFIAPAQIAGIFVDDPAVIMETVRILPPTASLYILFGPLLMFSSFFQAIGDAKLSALLGLTKIYVFSVPLILFFPYLVGERGIWYASPVTEMIALVLTVVVLYQTRRSSQGWTSFLEARA